jgi:3-oxoacyl-[acyl-carrier-protein] synthase-1/3-oxoacyl-[acyl-carrier-protein] synthase II
VIALIARGACSPLGEGEAAFAAAPVGSRAETQVARDEELARAGLSRPFCGRARVHAPAGVDRATALLDHALTEVTRELDEVLPDWRGLRVGAAIGTSSGGMRAFESFLDPSAAPLPALAATYVGPLVAAARPCAFEPASLVLGACASSTIAIGLGRTWLLGDRCDLVLCGGFDAVSVFVATGFESLRATCGPRGPRPFREGRDGLALGEGAAIVALVREPQARRSKRVHAWVSGFGATCDATHLTAPEAGGGGLARAARQAIDDAGGAAIDIVSGHGTATPQNDAAEAAAIRSALGPGAAAVPVFSSKGTIGHTLGAAGALEVLAAVDALARGIAPATAGEGPHEPGLRVLDRTEPAMVRTALKLSSAFGGANAALVVSAAPFPRPPHIAHPVHVTPAAHVTLADTDVPRLADRTGYGADRITRADDLVRLAMAAVAALEDANGGPGTLRGAGIVVGHGLATVETNARFQARIRASGPRRAEPRRFPYTTPNAVAGECAVAFHLTGPGFAVGGGPHGGIEAIGAAADLVRANVVDRVVVVAVDADGDTTERMAPGSKSGAVALLVHRAGSLARAGCARLEGCRVRFDAPVAVSDAAPGGRPLPPMHAHRALLPLVGGRPGAITAEVPWGGIANAAFFWL